MKKVDFDEYADDYDTLLGQQLNFFSEDVDYYARYKVDLVAELLGTGASERPLKILEFGCGTGRNLVTFRQLFPNAELTGYDISQKSIKVASDTIERVEFTSDLASLKSDYYDLIFVAGVYHHIEPSLRTQVTQDLYRYTKSNGGRLMVFEHNPFNPVTRKMVRECPFDEDAVLLRSSELKERLKVAGFSIESLKYTLFFPPNVFKHSFSLDKLFSWLPLGGQYYLSVIK